MSRTPAKSVLILLFVVYAASSTACGSAASPDAGEIWLNPQVEDHCLHLEQVQEAEGSGGTLPDGFPLPKGSQIEGTVPGDPPVVRLTAPGDFLELDSFFKSKLNDEGWAGAASSTGSDPTGRYGSVLVNGHGYRGGVSVVECGENDPEILIGLTRKRRA